MDKAAMNLGQLFLAGFSGVSVDRDHPVVETVQGDGLGGVILFDRNVDGSRQNILSPAQLQELTGSLQEFAVSPLLIAVDQEGGKVCRLKREDGFPGTESAASLGASGSRQEAADQAAGIAATLHRSGINLNLAPVVDLNLNLENPIIGRYERSFGPDPQTVAAFAGDFIDAHHARGVACCLKHFPGHGSSTGDSHLGFVDISTSWKQVELEPFRLLLEAGFADAVMTAHVVQRGLDREGFPATLSRPVISGLLRQQAGFDGVIISDDLQMKAITGRWSLEEAVRRCVLAGVDLMIIGNNLAREEDAVRRGIQAVRSLLDEGLVQQETVQRSLDRIARLKMKIAGKLPWKESQPTA